MFISQLHLMIVLLHLIVLLLHLLWMPDGLQDCLQPRFVCIDGKRSAEVTCA